MMRKTITALALTLLLASPAAAHASEVKPSSKLLTVSQVKKASNYSGNLKSITECSKDEKKTSCYLGMSGKTGKNTPMGIELTTFKSAADASLEASVLEGRARTAEEQNLLTILEVGNETVTTTLEHESYTEVTRSTRVKNNIVTVTCAIEGKVAKLPELKKCVDSITKAQAKKAIK